MRNKYWEDTQGKKKKNEKKMVGWQMGSGWENLQKDENKIKKITARDFCNFD